jgi:hypothetical protein
LELDDPLVVFRHAVVVDIEALWDRRQVNDRNRRLMADVRLGGLLHLEVADTIVGEPVPRHSRYSPCPPTSKTPWITEGSPDGAGDVPTRDWPLAPMAGRSDRMLAVTKAPARAVRYAGHVPPPRPP